MRGSKNYRISIHKIILTWQLVKIDTQFPLVYQKCVLSEHQAVKQIFSKKMYILYKFIIHTRPSPLHKFLMQIVIRFLSLLCKQIDKHIDSKLKSSAFPIGIQNHLKILEESFKNSGRIHSRTLLEQLIRNFLAASQTSEKLMLFIWWFFFSLSQVGIMQMTADFPNNYFFMNEKQMTSATNILVSYLAD